MRKWVCFTFFSALVFLKPCLGKAYEVEPIATYGVEALESDYLKSFCHTLDVGSKKCIENIKSVQKAEGFQGFDLTQHPISKNPLEIDQVEAVKVKYQTPGVFHDMRSVSGSFLIPHSKSGKIRGVVLFFHPTLFGKYNAPSYSKDNRILNVLADVFASQGYVVATPDYIGLGDDDKVAHPYIAYPKVNTDDGLSLLKVLKTYLADQKKISKSEHLNLFVASYSEGGGYALWFSKLAQMDPFQKKSDSYRSILNANHYVLKHTAGISGAYNYSQVAMDWFFSNTTTEDEKYNIASTFLSTASKAGLLAHFLVSYAYYHHVDAKKFLNPDFYDMKCSFFAFGCKLNGVQYNLSDIWTAKAKEAEIGRAVFSSSLGKSFSDKTYRILPTTANNGLALLSEDLSKNQEFKDFIAQSDIDSWKSVSPITLIYLKQDSIVTNLHSKMAYEKMHDLHQSPWVDQVEFDADLLSGVSPKVDHVKGMDYLMIPALLKFNQYR